jgi:hypothetical protein
MLQIEFFNRLNPKTREHHIDDTFIKVGPIETFQWTYSYLRLRNTKKEFDVLRHDSKEAVMYKGILFGDFRIVPYDPTDDSVEALTDESVNEKLKKIKK